MTTDTRGIYLPIVTPFKDGIVSSTIYFNIVSGGNGGILASAHLYAERFVRIFDLVEANDHQAARKEWDFISKTIPLLFREPNPAPVKYVLSKKGLIESDEVRSPLTAISPPLKAVFNELIGENVI